MSRLKPYSSLVPSLPSPVVSIAILVLVGSGVGRVAVFHVKMVVLVVGRDGCCSNCRSGCC